MLAYSTMTIMAIEMNSSITAIVPAVYGSSTPVINVGDGASSLNAAVALADVRSVVVNLGTTPRGGVTYSAAGLADEMSQAMVPMAPVATTKTQAEAPAPLPVLGTATSTPQSGQHQSDALYTSSGVLMPSGAVPADVAGSRSVGAAVPKTASASVGSLIGTRA